MFKISIAALSIKPLFNALTSASSSIMPPRATLIICKLGFAF